MVNLTFLVDIVPSYDVNNSELICLAIVCSYGSAFSKRNRGSYMSAHVLLNLLNELRKRDKMRGLPSV